MSDSESSECEDNSADPEYGFGDGQIEENSTRHLFVFSSEKSGMDYSCLSKDEQERIVRNVSRGSKYMQKAEVQDMQNNKRIARVLERAQNATYADSKRAEDHVAQMTAALENRRSFERHVVVLDMDSFFASVELRDRPELKDKPVAIGGDSMISTSNYVARKFGVRSGMPGFIARKLCPQLVFLPLNFSKYKCVSDQARDIICLVDPHYSQHSIDEFVFDVTDAALEEYRRSHMSSPVRPLALSVGHEVMRDFAESVVAKIRADIKHVTHVTCSAGIANNTQLAKICSNFNKPDGQFSLRPMNASSVRAFCDSLQTRQVGGIGKVSEKVLQSFGVRTLQDARKKMATLSLAFSSKFINFLLSSCIGVCEGEGCQRNLENIPSSAVDRRSIGVERTVGSISKKQEIYDILKALCEKLADELEKQNLWASHPPK